ncbi:hypothetical protein, partial [Alistipes sp. ZOR0009]|uniref:hypothetical protein n=1 Tax=Alistipes sp. ZOR0009 TaxID=1339253 RepID=UPI001E6322DD
PLRGFRRKPFWADGALATPSLGWLKTFLLPPTKRSLPSFPPVPVGSPLSPKADAKVPPFSGSARATCFFLRGHFINYSFKPDNLVYYKSIKIIFFLSSQPLFPKTDTTQE